jgi:asparagine synthetase B (glutamine-hydrolysing)
MDGLEINDNLENQFVLTSRSTEACTSSQGFVTTDLGEKYVLQSHRGLEVTTRRISENKIISIVGYFYDPAAPNLDRHQICETLNFTHDIADPINRISKLAGVFVVFLAHEADLYIFPDACAMREVYYNANSAASSPAFLKYKQAESDALPNSYFLSNEFRKRPVWIGDQTSYSDVRRIKPNHYIQLGKDRATRFFPVLRRVPIGIESGCENIKNHLQGTMQAVVTARPVMMSLTSGWDSRLLLAASRLVKSKILYCTIRHSHANVDAKISLRLIQALDLNYLQQWYSSTGPRFSYIDQISSILPNMDKNSPSAVCSSIFHCNPIIISGACSEIARIEYGRINRLSGKVLAKLARHSNHSYIEKSYDRWLEENEAYLQSLGYSTLDFFYWEEIMANRTAKDVAEAAALGKKVFPAFNSHHLIELLLCIDPVYRQKQDNLLYRKIITQMWPELLKFPINPHIRKQVIKLMQKFRFYDVYRNLFPQGIEKWLRRR